MIRALWLFVVFAYAAVVPGGVVWTQREIAMGNTEGEAFGAWLPLALGLGTVVGVWLVGMLLTDTALAWAGGSVLGWAIAAPIGLWHPDKLWALTGAVALFMCLFASAGQRNRKEQLVALRLEQMMAATVLRERLRGDIIDTHGDDRPGM